jgi:type IV pilus assembly protein PilA
MKNYLRQKALKYLNQKQQNSGFTLTELLIVFIIVGILSAIALPTFVNQSAKAKQSEAKVYIGSINRAQQAYRTENATFANEIDTLAIGVSTTTFNYEYSINVANSSLTAMIADPMDDAFLKGYSGAVNTTVTGATETIICQTINENVTTPVQIPTWDATTGTLSCTGNVESMP